MAGVDAELSNALAPLLNDLRSTGTALPRVEESPWPEFPEMAGAMLYEPDGSGLGVSIRRGAEPAEQLVSLADQLQEWTVEALWSEGRPAVWPDCPRHPDSHPLAARLVDEVAVWRCPRDEVLVAVIGRLAGG